MKTRRVIHRVVPGPTPDLLQRLDRVPPAEAAEVLLLATAALRHPTGSTISRALDMALRTKGV